MIISSGVYDVECAGLFWVCAESRDSEACRKCCSGRAAVELLLAVDAREFVDRLLVDAELLDRGLEA